MSSAVHLGTDTEMARAFEAAWAAPTPDRLVTLLHDDVVLLQPQLPPIRGKAAALAEFRRLFRWLPGTRGVVDRTVSASGIAMIEWRLVSSGEPGRRRRRIGFAARRPRPHGPTTRRRSW